MPRIDPMKLLVCLSVLLAPNGGIRAAAEVKRLANLMAKFSKKLVSKCIYIQILKCTETELLGQFMQTGGWALVHMWLVDGIGSKNWPLIQELLELLLCCPVDVERLKINSTPRLVKSLSTDSAHESVRLLATKLVEQWLSIVKAPKQPSSVATISQSPSELAAAITDAKSSAADHHQAVVGTGGGTQEGPRNGLLGAHNNRTTESHHHTNGYAANLAKNAENGQGDEEQYEQSHHGGADDVDAAKKTFRAIVEHQDQPSHKKTSLVLKITTKNGKQVVAKVITPSGKKGKAEEHGYEEDEDDEDEEEVLVNIESDKHPDEAPVEQQESKESKKLDGGDHHGAKEGSKERSSSSSSSKDKDHRHHRDHREKDRKSGGGSSSSGSRSSSSKSSSNSSSSSSSKHKSSSSSKSGSSSSSSSRDKDKERHGSSSSTSSSSKHKSSSSSSSSKSNGSSSKSGSSSSSSDKHRTERSSHSTGNKDSKDSKGGHSSSSPNSSHNSSSSSSSKHAAKLSRKNSKDEGGNDSGSESNANTTGAKSASSTSISSKKASISIEVRNPENRPKTVKTYNSQFRSHGLIEEAPPPPSRKGLKKPSSSSTGTTAASASSASVGSTASSTTAKRSSSPPSTAGKEGGVPPEKKLKEDPVERPGSIKLIPPKRQHALVESDMFMDALSATLRKDVKKRKRRTSGSENPAPTTKPAEQGGKPADGAASATTTAAKLAPESPSRTAAGETAAGATEATPTTTTTPTTPTSPKAAIVPTIAPMSFYRDTLAEEDEKKDGESGKEADAEGGKAADGGLEEKGKEGEDGKERDSGAATGAGGGEEDDDEDEAIVKKPKRVRCELNDDEEEEDDAGDGEKKKKKPEEAAADPTSEDADKTELMDVVMNDVEKKMAEEAEGGAAGGSADKDDEEPTGKKLPGPGCGPDGPPGVLVIHRRKGPKKQLRWRVADELEEIRYFELDVTERCNVTKSFTDMKQMERVDERQKFLMARKVGSEDVMVERTPWRPLLVVDNVPPPHDGSQSVERTVQHQRERGCLQALYFNKHMIPDSPVEPEPADMYQTADPVHIPLEDVTGNPDSVNDFTSMPWPDPKSTPPHESAAFNSPFFPADLPPGGGFGPGGFPPPFQPGAVGSGPPAAWSVHTRPGVLQPGMFPLNQPPPGMAAAGGAGGGGGGSPNILSLPPPGMFPGATNFNAPPPDLALMGGDVGGRRPPGAGGDRGASDFRSGPPPPQQWVSGNGGRPYGGHNQRGGGAFGNRGGGPGNWNRSAGSTGDRGRNGEEGRGNYRGHWMQNNSNRGHNNHRGTGGGGRKW